MGLFEKLAHAPFVLFCDFIFTGIIFMLATCPLAEPYFQTDTWAYRLAVTAVFVAIILILTSRFPIVGKIMAGISSVAIGVIVALFIPMFTENNVVCIGVKIVAGIFTFLLLFWYKKKKIDYLFSSDF